jgi:RsiW-degrading membrane proteinase PrsW (M82 family)
LKFSDCFTDIFKPHKSGELEKFFMSGMRTTTPAPNQMLGEWNKPWIFTRLFIIALILSVFAVKANYLDTIPILQAIITAFVPLTCMMFIWEMNIPRNIPAYQILFLLFVGGISSMIFVLLGDEQFHIRTWLGEELLPYCIMNAVLEETAKALIIVIFILWRQSKGINDRHILTGMLIGCVIGTGFDAFETGHYLHYAEPAERESLLFERIWQSPGGHLIWASLYGAGLAAAKGREKLRLSHFMDKNFIIWFAFPILLHTFWNYSSAIVKTQREQDLYYIALIIIPWAAVMKLINDGVKQIVEENNLYAGNPQPNYQQQNYQQANYQQPNYQQQNYQQYPQQSSFGNAVGIKGIRGQFANKTVNIGQTLRIGRDPKRCNLIFNATTPGISGFHCELTFNGNSTELIDRGSSNGTFLNNARIQPNTPYRVKPGDVFYLGSGENTFTIF